MRPDFSLIWGSDNAPFTPIEASDYTAGWVFRTGAPPRRVNFDYFQNLSDQRTAWLGEQMLLAVGHEWQDDVTYDAFAVVRSPVNGQLYRSLVGSNLNNEPSVSGAQWALGVPDTINTPIATVAAAGTIDLTTGAPDTSQIAISGTGVSINGFTVAANRFFVVKMTGASNTLVNSASLVTGRGANITVVAGDTFLMRSTAANTVEIIGFVENPVPRASLTANGWQRLPSGLIIQWGNSAVTNTSITVTFPIAFPNAVLRLLENDFSTQSNKTIWSADLVTNTGLRANNLGQLVKGSTTFNPSIDSSYPWFAIGY